MTDAIGAQRVERSADRRNTTDLAGVRHRSETELVRNVEYGSERLGRELDLQAAEPHADHASIAVLGRGPHGLLRRFHHPLGTRLEIARDIGREAHFDAEPFARLVHPVAEPREHLVPGRSVPHRFRRGKDPLEVDGSERDGLLGVRDDDLAEVAFGTQGVRGHGPHLDEVRKIAEPVQLGQLRFRRGRQRDAVPAGDPQQGTGAHRALQVHVQLDLGVGRLHGRSG